MSGSFVTPIPLKTGWWLGAIALALFCCRPETIRDDRLFIRADALTAIKEQIRQPSTHHHQAFEALKWRVDQGDLSVYGSGINRYNRSFYAQELAFVCLMAEEEDQRQDYARRAFEAVQDIYRAPEQERLPHKDYGLSRAMMQLGLAMPYAWCRRYWNEDQKHYVEEKINAALDAWLTYDHANFGDTRTLTWQLNLGDHQGDGGIEVERSAGQFRLLSSQGVVDGWITGLRKFEFGTSDDPFQVHYPSGQSPMSVIMYVHGDPGSIPHLVEDDAGAILNDTYRIRYDREASRVVIENQ